MTGCIQLIPKYITAQAFPLMLRNDDVRQWITTEFHCTGQPFNFY